MRNNTPTTKKYKSSVEAEVTQKTGAPSFFDTFPDVPLDHHDQEQTAVTPSPFDLKPVTMLERSAPRSHRSVISEEIISVEDTGFEPGLIFEEMTTNPYQPKPSTPTRSAEKKRNSDSVPLPRHQQPGQEVQDDDEIPKDLTTSWDTTQKVQVPRQIVIDRPLAEPTFLCDPQEKSDRRYIGPLLILSMLIMAGVGLLLLAYR